MYGVVGRQTRFFFIKDGEGIETFCICYLCDAPGTGLERDPDFCVDQHFFFADFF